MVARQGTQSIERPRTYPSQNLTVNAASIFFLLSSIMEARSHGYLSAHDNKCHTSKMCDRSAGSRELSLCALHASMRDGCTLQWMK